MKALTSAARRDGSSLRMRDCKLPEAKYSPKANPSAVWTAITPRNNIAHTQQRQFESRLTQHKQRGRAKQHGRASKIRTPGTARPVAHGAPGDRQSNRGGAGAPCTRVALAAHDAGHAPCVLLADSRRTGPAPDHAGMAW